MLTHDSRSDLPLILSIPWFPSKLRGVFLENVWWSTIFGQLDRRNPWQSSNLLCMSVIFSFNWYSSDPVSTAVELVLTRITLDLCSVFLFFFFSILVRDFSVFNWMNFWKTSLFFWSSDRMKTRVLLSKILMDYDRFELRSWLPIDEENCRRWRQVPNLYIVLKIGMGTIISILKRISQHAAAV